MFDIGLQELIVIFIVALLVFGAKRLPELGRTIGKGLSEIKRSIEEAKEQVDRELREAEYQEILKRHDLGIDRDTNQDSSGIRPEDPSSERKD